MLALVTRITLIIVCIALTLPHLSAQDLSHFRFTHLTTEDGLSQSTINDILQDSRGFLWFGTDDGLNRYDGYTFEVYKNIPGDQTSISSNIITGLIEDFESNIWIATNGGGLNKFDRRTERFERYRHNRNNSNSLSNDFITALYQDFTGVMLIGTQSGLNIFDPRTGRFNRYQAEYGQAGDLGHDQITDVVKDIEGMIWIGTQNGGLYMFDRFQENFTQYKPGDGSGFNDMWVSSLYLDEEGILWAGTQANGLFRFDRESYTFQNYRARVRDNSSISHNWILSMYEDEYGSFWVGTMNGLNLMDRENGTFSNISQEQPSYLSNYSISALYEDKSGVFWIGTRDGALNKLVRSSESFTVFQNEPGNPNSISDNNVWAVLESSDGDVWFGTHGGGLNRYNPDTRMMTRYYNDPADSTTLSDNFVNTLMEDRYGNIWVGTINGLNKFDSDSSTFGRFRYDPQDQNTIGGNQITALMEDRNGIIWIGTLNSGLTGYNPETKEMQRFHHDADDPESLSHNKVWSLYEDRYGNFWLGTHGFGLNRYDRVNEVFEHYTHEPGNPNSLSDNFINFIHESSSGELWIGTINGLNRFNRDQQEFHRYSTRDGLPNNVLYGIIEDERGHLWLSTNNGIADFNPQTGTSRNYGVGDGLPGNEYRFGAFHHGSSGRMYFGGIDGAVAFEADSIRDNPYIPPVVLTNFQIYNRDVAIDEESFLKQSITETRDIRITHRESVFSFEFAGLHFASPRHNQYAFMLEGFEDGWQYVGSRRFTSYTNLPPGNYTFRVKASNKDGIWNEEGIALSMVITPPLWQTWWAYSLYGIFFVGFMVGIVQYRVSKEQSKKQQLIDQKRELEEEVSLRTIELAEEKKKGDQLLRNILPGDVADQLIRTGKAEPKKYDEVTILFTDFKNFTDIASSMNASRLVNELNDIFGAFDRILEENNVEKIKTIGDSYMAVGGIPDIDPNHAFNVVKTAIEMIEYIENRNLDSSFKWQMRAGVHTGGVIAGVVGKNKFTFDLWGDSVIIASRMEQTGEPGKVNVSAVTRELIKDLFDCEYRGKLAASGKGKLDMYFAHRPDERKKQRHAIEG